jgi:MFS transporter, PPP family, 3-phenylpropionic acid transporter
MTARRFGLRISVTYAFLMIGSGVQLPFLPLWLAEKGVSVEGIAMIMAGMMATRIVGAPLFAWMADYFGNRRLVIQLCAFFALLSYALLAISNGFGPIMTVAIIASFMFAPVFPLTEGFSVDGAAAHNLDYGRLRLWASVSFLAGALGGGALLTVLDPLDTVWILALAQGIAFLATLYLPTEPDVEEDEPSDSSVTGVGELLFKTSFPLLMIAAGLAQASHGFQNSFSSVHWQSLGYSTFWIGFFWLIAVAVEILLFSFSNAVVATLGPGRLLLIGMAGATVRWLMLGSFESFAFQIAAQTLHGVSFAATHLGTMHFIRLMVPTGIRNRAQGIYSAISGGILFSSVIYASGPLYRAYGGQAYYAMAVLAAISFALAFSLLRFSPRVREAGAA